MNASNAYKTMIQYRRRRHTPNTKNEDQHQKSYGLYSIELYYALSINTILLNIIRLIFHQLIYN